MVVCGCDAGWLSLLILSVVMVVIVADVSITHQCQVHTTYDRQQHRTSYITYKCQPSTTHNQCIHTIAYDS